MKWFAEEHRYRSDKNGEIIVRRDLGVWFISVLDCYQTGPYTHKMWHQALPRARARFPEISTVLMLGLGAGGEIRTINTYFPDSRLTVMEYDPQMIEIAKSLGLHHPLPFPRVICADAYTEVSKLTESYDLILVDMFSGPEPVAFITDPSFIDALKEHLNEHGVVLVNAHKRPEYLEPYKKAFPHYPDTWLFRLNNLGLFQKKS